MNVDKAHSLSTTDMLMLSCAFISLFIPSISINGQGMVNPIAFPTLWKIGVGSMARHNELHGDAGTAVAVVYRVDTERRKRREFLLLPLSQRLPKEGFR